MKPPSTRAKQDAVETYNDIVSSPEGKNITNKMVEASGDREESHFGPMGDDFTA